MAQQAQSEQYERPDLSIVIVNWNTRELLDDCLRSIYHETRELDLEVFVIDNASQDGSADMVQRDYPSVELIRNSENRGFGAATNQGLRACLGRYALLLNSDTVILGDVVKESVAYMDAHPEVGVLGCRVLNEDRTVQRTCSQFPTILNLFLLVSGLPKVPGANFFDRFELGDWQRDDVRDVDVVSGCSMCVRREAMEEVGLLDEQFFFYGEETDWCKRLKLAGWPCRFAPVGEIIHFGGASSQKLGYKADLLLSQGLVRFQFFPTLRTGSGHRSSLP